MSFQNSAYTASESDGFGVVCLQVNNTGPEMLGRVIGVLLNFIDGTASMWRSICMYIVFKSRRCYKTRNRL